MALSSLVQKYIKFEALKDFLEMTTPLLMALSSLVQKYIKFEALKDFLEMTTPTPSLSLSTLSEVLQQVNCGMAIFESTGE